MGAAVGTEAGFGEYGAGKIASASPTVFYDASKDTGMANKPIVGIDLQQCLLLRGGEIPLTTAIRCF